MCGGHKFNKFFLLRILIALAILAVVFAFGIKLGELKGSLQGDLRDRGYYGHERMMDYRYYPQMQYHMMNVPAELQQQQVAPAPASSSSR